MNDNWWLEVTVSDRNLSYVIGPLTFDEKQEFEQEICDVNQKGEYRTVLSFKYLTPITIANFRKLHASV